MEQVKNNEFKKRLAIVLCFLVLMVCITGSTYAYFALTASSNNITGNVGGAGLSLTVTKKFPTANKNMIPQLESTLDRAISDEFSCIDGNGNMVCQVYQATVTNSSDIVAKVNGTIRFEGIEREAGLYDDNWNMIVSWSELVNDYGLDITYDDYSGADDRTLASIIGNNSNFSLVSKIVVSNDVSVIGYEQIHSLSYLGISISEIALPDNVIINFVSELNELSIEKIYYSGDDESVWADNATIVPRESLGTKMPNLKWKRIDGERVIGGYSSNTATTEPVIFDENKLFNAGTTENYYFVIWIDEIGRAQYDQGTFRAVIEFNTADDGLTSTIKTSLVENIASLYNDGSEINTVHIAGDASRQAVSLNAARGLMKINQGSTYGEEYRYYGENPNNYVEYNGELWRIISSSKVFFSESDTVGEQRVRLIKNTTIGNYAWDNDEGNNWTNSTLMCQLNTRYYNDTIPVCAGKTLTSLTSSLNEEAKSLIDEALWYLGGRENAGGDVGNYLYADDWYSAERGNLVATEGNPIKFVANVGIIYPSDYLYATDLSVCLAPSYGYKWSDDTLDGYDKVIDCKKNDWLYINNSGWTISVRTDVGTAFYIEGGAVYGGPYGPAGAKPIYPVVTLKANVMVAGGDGTSGSPYILGI